MVLEDDLCVVTFSDMDGDSDKVDLVNNNQLGNIGPKLTSRQNRSCGKIDIVLIGLSTCRSMGYTSESRSQRPVPLRGFHISLRHRWLDM